MATGQAAIIYSLEIIIWGKFDDEDLGILSLWYSGGLAAEFCLRWKNTN